MKTHLTLFAVAALATTLACDREPTSGPMQTTQADLGRATDKLDDATEVLSELTTTHEIPRAQRERARCIVVIPKMKSGAFLVGGEHGDGVVTCRTPSGWSGPAFIKLTGPTVGLQVGVQSADILMLVMADGAVSKLFRKDFQLGADASVAAGPVGDSTKATTDAQATAEFLTYSRTRGLFAGAEVKGLVVKQNLVYEVAIYGVGAEAKTILNGDRAIPKEAAPLLRQVRQLF